MILRVPLKQAVLGVTAIFSTFGAALGQDGKPQTRNSEPEALFDRYFAKRDGVLPCYAATLTDADREANPGRQITRLGVRHSRDDELDGAPVVFELVFVWALNSATTWAAVEAQCSMVGEAADCLIEGDGANYQLVPDGDNLAFTAGALNIEIMDAMTEWFGEPSQAHTITLTQSDAEFCEMT